MFTNIFILLQIIQNSTYSIYKNYNNVYFVKMSKDENRSFSNLKLLIKQRTRYVIASSKRSVTLVAAAVCLSTVSGYNVIIVPSRMIGVISHLRAPRATETFE